VGLEGSKIDYHTLLLSQQKVLRDPEVTTTGTNEVHLKILSRFLQGNEAMI
jgi:hypothetical protein